MSAWLKQNWKVLLAVVGGLVIVILLYLRSRSSSGAGTISFPANPIAGGGGAAPSDSSSSTSSSTPLSLSGWHFGFPPAGAKYAWRLTPAGQAWFQKVTGSAWTQGIMPGWLDPTSILPANWPAYAWEVVELAPGTSYTDYGLGEDPGTASSSSGTPSGNGQVPAIGQGGPGAVYGLQRAALAAQAASHRLALRSTRSSNRLALDARQAASESRRIYQESRGAAPVGGPGRFLPLSARTRWPR